VLEWIYRFSTVVSGEMLINTSGILLFASWLLRTSLGKTALEQAPVRRINTSPLFVIAALFIWQIPSSYVIFALRSDLRTWPDWYAWLIRNVVMAGGAVLTILFIGIVAWFTYARRLKGLGLGLRNLHKDFLHAVVILFCLFPLVLAAIALTTTLGQQVFGPDYHIEQHKELEVFADHPQLSLKLSVVLLAVLVAPAVEELIFRGLIQTMVVSYIQRPWWGIIIASGIFAAFHENWQHWPALFVLSMGIGYAYEKSGSLWQAFFIHALFNGSTILSYLL